MLKHAAAFGRAAARLRFAFATPSFAQERTVKITGFGAKSGVVRVFGVNSEAAHEGGRRGDQQGRRRDARRRHQGQVHGRIPRRPLQCRGRHLGGAPHRLDRRFRRGRPDLLERRRVAVRHPAEEGRRRVRQRAAVPDHRRRRGQGRARQDLRMGVPQRAERIRDVQVAVRLAQDAASGPEDHLRRRREGLRAFERHLRRDEGARPKANGFQVLGTGRMAARRHDLLDPGARNEARQCRHRRDLGASVHDLRRAQGDGAPGRQAEAPDRPDLLVEHRDAAGLRQAGRGHHHPDQLRAGDAGSHQGGRAASRSSAAAPTCTAPRPTRSCSSSRT